MTKLINKFLTLLKWARTFLIILKGRGLDTYGRMDLLQAISVHVSTLAVKLDNQIYAEQTIHRLIKMLDTGKYYALERVGPEHDSGYFLPKNIPIKEVISGGVGKNYEFESLLAIKGLDVHMFDGSVAKVTNSSKSLSFYPKFLKPAWDSSQKSITLSEILNNHVHYCHDILLKLDIEGDEYDILLEQVNEMQPFSVLVIEFHSLYRLSDLKFNQRFNEIFDALEKEFIPIYHNANNNRNHIQFGTSFVPEVIEIVFANKRHKSKLIERTSTYLDVANNPKRLAIPRGPFLYEL